MHRLPRPRAPWWFVVGVAVAFAVALRVWAPSLASGPSGGGPHDPPAFAWWTFLISLVEVLWKGVEVAGRVALVVLQYSVQLLWRFVNIIAKGVGEAAQFAWRGLRAGWDLLKVTYSHVLKPAWQFFWKWVDKVERWLERTFGPLLTWLRRVRQWLLDFWAVYIRPILDLLDISRRALRVLGALGLDWARALDQKIADLEERIEAPFRALVAKVNDVINVINRVITLDGLFQKLAFVRSVERDISEVSRAFVNWRPIDFTKLKWDAVQTKLDERDQAAVVASCTDILERDGGKYAALVDEVVATGRRHLSGQ